MDSVLHPRGPAGSRAYWIRRGLVIATGVVLGTVVWALAAQFVAKPRENAAASDPSTSATPGTALVTGDLPECVPENLVVSVAGKPVVTSGATQNLVVSVVNENDEACLATISPRTFSFTITSGIDRIWATSDCVAFAPDAQAALDRHGTWTWSLNWTTQRAVKCELSTTKLGAGTYIATAHLVGAGPAKFVMQLR